MRWKANDLTKSKILRIITLNMSVKVKYSWYSLLKWFTNLRLSFPFDEVHKIYKLERKIFFLLKVNYVKNVSYFYVTKIHANGYFIINTKFCGWNECNDLYQIAEILKNDKYRCRSLFLKCHNPSFYTLLIKIVLLSNPIDRQM